MIERINWGALPNIPSVTLDLIAGKAPIVSLFGGDWRSEDNRNSVAEQRAGFDRPAGLGEDIRKGYRDLYLSDAVNENIDALNRKDTLAIVTGQQVGIFGGPIYTYYKALSTILLAEYLTKESGRKVVPVFWMETTDADFDEVNRIGFPVSVDEDHHVAYSPADIVVGKSINFYRLSPEINTISSDVAGWLETLPHGHNLIDLVKRSYRSGRRLADAFLELINSLLGDMGLVMINPLFPALAERTAGFWNLCLSKPEKLNKSFILASRDLKEHNYPLQVRLRDDVLPIMHIDKTGIRHRIQGTTNAWKLTRDDNAVINNEELREIGRDKPLSLSTSALLRPLLQDWLLPTWMYVAGPYEIAYHAQVGRCYDLLDIPRPLIAPRISATLVEPVASRLLVRNTWSTTDVIGGREIMLRRRGRTTSMEDLFDSGAEQLNRWLDRIAEDADEAAVNVSNEIDIAGRKMNYQWEKLKSITSRKVVERDRVRVNHTDKLLEMLMPDGVLQERHDNVLYYLAAYGHKLTEALREEVDFFKPWHLAISLEAE